jgi:hypothetical protein
MKDKSAKNKTKKQKIDAKNEKEKQEVRNSCEK